MEIITKNQIKDIVVKILRDVKDINDKKANYYNTNINIKDYESLKVGDDWSAAISKAVEDLSEGGILYFPKGVYNTKELFPTYKSITILGAGYSHSIIQYTGIATEGAFIDIRIKGFSIKDIGIYGCNEKSSNPVNGQKCSGIYIRERENGGANGGQVIENIMTKYFGEDGIKIHLKVWMLMLNNVRAYCNTNIGINIRGTDNTYSNLHCEGNGVRGLSVTGGNNRISNVNCIFNGKDSKNGCEGYFNAGHLSLSNVVCQDAYHDGFVFDSCFESNIDIISDCCGVSLIDGNETIPISCGVKFINKCRNIIGNIQLTNYRSFVGSQLYGIYMDKSCYNTDIAYYDASLSKEGSLFESNMYNNIRSSSSFMNSKFAISGKVIKNIVSSPDLSDAKYIMQRDSVSSLTAKNGVGTVTIDGNAQYNRFIQIKEPQLQHHVYYHQIKAKTTTEGFGVALFSNSELLTPPYAKANRMSVPSDNEWHTYSWITSCSGNTDQLFMTCAFSGEGTGVAYIKEPICIDLTEDLGLCYELSKAEVVSFDTSWFDKVIEEIGWFSDTSSI